MRQLEITYPGVDNFTDFTFDPLGRRVKIVETVSGSAATRQFVWSFGAKPRESRDGSSTIVSQFFTRGQMDTTNSRPYCLNHLGSVTEATNSTGVIQGQQNFDPFGRDTQLQGSYVPDFGYAGYYVHARSGLNLTLTRAFKPALAKWLSFDPIEEDGGINLSAYVRNAPVEFTDPSGLFLRIPTPEPPSNVAPVPSPIMGPPPPPPPPGIGGGGTGGIPRGRGTRGGGVPRRCDEILKDIMEALDTLSSLEDQIIRNPEGIPMFKCNKESKRKGSVEGHQEKFTNWQENLRNRVDEWNNAGCVGPLSPRVQVYTRYPGVPWPELPPHDVY